MLTFLNTFFGCWTQISNKWECHKLIIHDIFFFPAKMWLPDSYMALDLGGGKLFTYKLDTNLDGLQFQFLDA